MVVITKNVANLLKWAVIVAILFIVYKCIRNDSENYSEIKKTAKKKVDNAENIYSSGGGSAGSSGGGSAGSCGSGSKGKTCGGKGGCTSASGDRLLPVLDPCFNMREICKNAILLEDHLAQKSKRCEDCCKKHFLTIEGLAEEAITLDKDNKYNFDKLDLPEKIRKLERRFIDGEDPLSIQQELRQIRKPLMEKYFDRF